MPVCVSPPAKAPSGTISPAARAPHPDELVHTVGVEGADEPCEPPEAFAARLTL